LGKQMALNQVFDDEGIAEFRWEIRELANNVVSRHLDFRRPDFVAIYNGNDLIFLCLLGLAGNGPDRAEGGHKQGRSQDCTKSQHKFHRLQVRFTDIRTAFGRLLGVKQGKNMPPG
jgi:hypothetical protein